MCPSVKEHFGSLRASQAEAANVGLALEFEADHEMQAVCSIADVPQPPGLGSERPIADYG